VNNEFYAGQKIWYRDVLGGMHKAVVISTRKTTWYGGIGGLKYATIKITSRGDRAFYRGYIFEGSQTFMSERL